MQTNEKTHRGVGRASDDLTFDCFYRRALPCQTLRRPAKRRRAPITLLFVVLLGRSQTEEQRSCFHPALDFAVCASWDVFD